jgi:uncharacterized spore protein YtfJ
MATETQGRSEVVNELLERVAETVGRRAQVSTVFGEPVEREGLTVIPVARARFGCGAGGGSGAHEGEQGSGGGGGGGGVVHPVGYIEVRDGSAIFKRITSPIDLLPLALAVALATLTAEAPARLDRSWYTRSSGGLPNVGQNTTLAVGLLSSRAVSKASTQPRPPKCKDPRRRCGLFAGWAPGRTPTRRRGEAGTPEPRPPSAAHSACQSTSRSGTSNT